MTGRATDADVIAARELARRVEREAGTVELPLDEVLALFKVSRLTVARRERLHEALDLAGLAIDPSVLVARRRKPVVITRRERGVEPAALHPRPDQLASAPSVQGAGHAEQPSRSSFTALSRSTKFIVVTVVATVIAGFVMLFFSPERIAARIAWHWNNKTVTGSPSSCQDTGWFHEIEIAGASAFYELDGHLAHESIDNNRTTAWRQVIRHNGYDYIAWGLSKNPADKRHVRLVCIRNGWAKNILTYRDTGRVRKLRLSGLIHEKPLAASGCRRTATLKDTAADRFGDFVGVTFDCEASAVRLDIRSTYDGLAEPDDVAISDVRFYE